MIDDVENSEGESDFSSKAEDFRSLSLSSSDWTVETVFNQIRKGNIDLSPEFQRRQVWDEKKQTAFIESLMLGIPVPQVVIAQHGVERGKYIVLDGKQRLLTIKNFYEGRLTLQRPELLEELSGLSREDLDTMYVDALDNATIRAVRLTGCNNESVLYTIFYRLNTGSVSLNPQELRFALMPGPFARFASSYTERDFEFAQLFNAGADGPDFRMRDIELFTRYCGIAHRPDLYGGSLKDFLDETTRWLNAINDDKAYESFASEAVRAISVYREVYDLIAELGQQGQNRIPAFCLLQPGKKPRFNRAVFDALCFSAQDVEVREFVHSNRRKVASRLKEILSDPEFINACSLSTKTKSSLVARVGIWSAALSEVIGEKVKTITIDDDGKIIVE